MQGKKESYVQQNKASRKQVHNTEYIIQASKWNRRPFWPPLTRGRNPCQMAGQASFRRRFQNRPGPDQTPEIASGATRKTPEVYQSGSWSGPASKPTHKYTEEQSIDDGHTGLRGTPETTARPA